jgi:hypothetical protein
VALPRRSIVSIVAIVLVAATAYAVARSKRDFWDFEVYRTAGVRALAGEPLYRADDGHYQFKYWPAFAFAMIPFGFIHPEVGKVLWYGLSVYFVATFLRQSIRIIPERRSTPRFLAWCTLLLTGKFIVIELVNGQTNALLGMLVVLALAAAQADRPALSGALVAISIFVKPYALLLLPWLALTQAARASISAIAVLLAGLMFPAFVYGWHGNLELLMGWYQTVVGTTPENLMLAENISFATMWAKWIGEGSAASTLALVTTVTVLAVAMLIWARRNRFSQPAYLEVGYLLLVMPLISPQGWDYVLLLATPAIVCLVDRFMAMALAWRVVTAAGLALTSFTIYDLVGRTLYFALMASSGITIGALLLASSLVGLRIKSLA